MRRAACLKQWKTLRRLAIGWLMLAAAGIADPARADAFDPLKYANVELVARQAQLLEAMLAQPGNLDLAIEYAAVSIQLGDFEAAISTLERLLIYAPGLASIQLELGVLYFRLGSFEAARTYLDLAKTSGGGAEDITGKADLYLAAISRAEEPAAFSGTVYLGTRYQSNANAGPGDRLVTLYGVPTLLDDTSTGQPDISAFLSGSLHGTYDLGNQGDLLEADLLFYGERYADFGRLDTELAELTFGPTFSMGRFNIDNARLGIFGIAGGARLDNANYSGTLGGGLKFAIQPDVRTTIDAKAEIRRRWFNDTSTYPSVSDRDGYRLAGVGTYGYAMSEAWALRVRLLGGYDEASANFEQNWVAGVALGATYSFASLVGSIDFPWSLDLETGYLRRAYDAPDPAVSLTQSERDNEFWLRGTLRFPVQEDVAIAVSGEFRRLESNYDIRDFSDATAMVAIQKNF